MDCVRKKCLLAVTGGGDPTGHGDGYSYLRLANKPSHGKKKDHMLPDARVPRNKQV